MFFYFNLHWGAFVFTTDESCMRIYASTVLYSVLDLQGEFAYNLLPVYVHHFSARFTCSSKVFH